MNVGIYARVSKAVQSVDLQISELTQHAQRMNWTIVATYLDEGVSGTKDSRPGLDALLKDARMKRFDAVLIWRLDRFGRSVSQLVQNVQALDSFGVRFISLTDNIDTDIKSPTGKLLLHLMAAFAEFERSLIVERVRAGVTEAKRQGKHCGRPARIFRRDEALRLRQEGLSWSRIAKQLGVPSSTVRLALQKVLPMTQTSEAVNTPIS